MATNAGILDSVGRPCRTDTPEFISPAMGEYLADALAVYSRHRPRHDVEGVTGLGTNFLTVPTTWVEQFSVIESVVYPYVDEDSSVLEADDYMIRHDDVSGTPTEKVWFRGYSPGTGETVRFWFTVPHTCSDTVCTIYAQDAAGFAHLVCSVIETAKASFYLGMKDVGVETDLIDYGAKSNEARALARMHMESYRTALGLPKNPDAPVPAAVAGDIDTEPQHGLTSAMRYRRSRYR